MRKQGLERIRSVVALSVLTLSALLLTAPVRADEIDLNGAWQLDFDCLGSPRGSNFFTITENVGTGALDAGAASCSDEYGTGSQVREVASCGTVPPSASTPGQVTGAQLRIPATGTVRFRTTYVDPFTAFTCNSPPALHSESNQFIQGTIAADRSISGNLTLSNIQYLDAAENPCFTFPFSSFDCSMLMRRTDLPPTCTIDGIRSAYEECDDGDLVEGDGCDSTCLPTGCGSGVPTGAEECDDGDDENGDGCDVNCKTSRCGNGALDPDTEVEQCDDGNLTNGDGCDSTCQYERTDLNGLWRLDYECGSIDSFQYVDIDENLANGAMALTTTDCGEVTVDGTSHVLASCNTIPPSASISGQNNGNGVAIPASGTVRVNSVLATPAPYSPSICSGANVTRSEVTQAFSGAIGADLSITGTVNITNFAVFGASGPACFSQPGGFCSLLMRRADLPAGCVVDGIRSVDEECDDGNAIDGDGCDSTCRPTGCGSGVPTGTEECDDGDFENGDGCDANCTTSRCGNDELDPNPAVEECDDGNLADFDGCSASCELEQLDLRGSWQVTAECIGSTATTSLTIAQADVGTGDLEVTQSCDGATVWDGEIREWGSCSVTPTPIEGKTTGSSVRIPDVGSYVNDVTFANPWTFTSCNPDLLARIVTPVRFEGAVVAGNGAGVATRVTGTQRLLGADFYDTADELCTSLPTNLITCSFVMLRNGVTVGSDVTVEPLEDTTVTFETVTSPGAVTVTALTEVGGEIPANFQVADAPIFYDVEATSVFEGVITVCIPYPDANGDGFVDGTTPPIAESGLRLLHRESGVFVDRTAAGSPDPVANVICAETTSLSPFVIAADRGATGEPLTGKKLLLKRASDDAKSRLVLLSKDTAIDLGAGNASADDPVTNGAALRIVGEGGAFDVVHPLPASGWSYVGPQGANKGYKYKSDVGPIRKLIVKSGGGALLKIVGKGSGLVPSLSSDPGPITAALTLGTKSSCTSFGGDTTFVPTKSFQAKNAPAPASCGAP